MELREEIKTTTTIRRISKLRNHCTDITSSKQLKGRELKEETEVGDQLSESQDRQSVFTLTLCRLYKMDMKKRE